MLLCIDTGNTNSVFSIWDGKEFLSHWRISTDHRRTADEYFVWLQTMISLRHFDLDIDACIISTTAPRVLFNLRVLCSRYFNTRPLVVGRPETLLPVQPRVDAGTKVGPDRLANVVAAHDRHGGNSVVVDFGTATNFDVVDDDGAYIGGVIAPGVNLSLEALHMAAAALPHVDVTMPEKVIGTNTVACIQSGIYWGYIGLIEGLIKRIRAERDR
ncbi:MAG: type III pantothenate kinase, partial [Paracoccus sp. (in: a-proteobacteria)]